MTDAWDWDDADETVAQNLQSLLPVNVFDVHAHLYRTSDFGDNAPGLVKPGPDMATAAVWRQYVGRQIGEQRSTGALFIPYPMRDVAIGTLNNHFLEMLAEAADTIAECRGLVLITPDTDPGQAREWLMQPLVTGFKPYHVYSAEQPTFQSTLRGFLAEWVWELADEHNAVITIHLVRSGALADPDNQRELLTMCSRYPNARVILAHAARGFHAPNTVGAVHVLAGLQNVWFDTSGICETAALNAVLREFGPRRLLFGSDFPVSEHRGKCVTIGDQFSWINPPRVDVYPHAPPLQTLPVGLESLRAVLTSADDCCLNPEDLQDVFCDNARRLFGFLPENTNQTQTLYEHAKTRIPGGTHLLSKRPEMFAPSQWPAYFREARGCEIWDLDGGRYIDMSINSVGACLLGVRDPDVTRAVKRCLDLGNIGTLNPPEEVELADMLCDIHPWADSVRFARTGGEVAAVAIRIARSTTDRSQVAVCGYHGWSDWYLAANLGEDDSLRGHLLPGLDPLGVPRELRGTVHTFPFNDRERFTEILAAHGDNLAAVVMEPCRYEDPEPGFLQFVSDETHRAGAVLIFDEITIGWRRVYGGSHLLLGVNPDMALFAKTLSNGYPMGAIIGT